MEEASHPTRKKKWNLNHSCGNIAQRIASAMHSKCYRSHSFYEKVLYSGLPSTGTFSSIVNNLNGGEGEFSGPIPSWASTADSCSWGKLLLKLPHLSIYSNGEEEGQPFIWNENAYRFFQCKIIGMWALTCSVQSHISVCPDMMCTVWSMNYDFSQKYPI